jgi:hypothetical protein
MGALNVTSILYTAYRLAPFILVSFFTLSSVLNQDLKGIIYLAGLLFACFTSTTLGNTPLFSNDNIDNPEYKRICDAITLTDDGPLSRLPLSMTVFSYTFFYLLYTVIYYNLAGKNITMMILFSSIIIADWIWHNNFKCNSNQKLLASLLVGFVIGFGWSAIIASTNQIQLQYLNGISNKEYCSLPTTQRFKCSSS